MYSVFLVVRDVELCPVDFVIRLIIFQLSCRFRVTIDIDYEILQCINTKFENRVSIFYFQSKKTMCKIIADYVCFKWTIGIHGNDGTSKRKMKLIYSAKTGNKWETYLAKNGKRHRSCQKKLRKYMESWLIWWWLF